MQQQNKIRIWFRDDSYTIIDSILDIRNYDNVVSMEYM